MKRTNGIVDEPCDGIIGLWHPRSGGQRWGSGEWGGDGRRRWQPALIDHGGQQGLPEAGSVGSQECLTAYDQCAKRQAGDGGHHHQP